MENESEIMTPDAAEIRNRIYTIRGKQVMLDSDLAELYGYEVKNLNRQVKRNIRRFPKDFMFQLTRDEMEILRCQNVTANVKSRTLPYAFTEQGIYMLATVLRGELAEQQSIFIMRAFREMRHFIANNAALFDRISKVELKQLEADSLPKIESPGVVWRFFCVKRQILSFPLLFMVFSIIL